jgi:hypothetical protein
MKLPNGARIFFPPWESFSDSQYDALHAVCMCLRMPTRLFCKFHGSRFEFQKIPGVVCSRLALDLPILGFQRASSGFINPHGGVVPDTGQGYCTYHGTKDARIILQEGCVKPGHNNVIRKTGVYHCTDPRTSLMYASPQLFGSDMYRCLFELHVYSANAHSSWAYTKADVCNEAITITALVLVHCDDVQHIPLCV